MTENSTPSAGTQRRRGVGRPFEKGKSGNPGGRPKGVVERIKKLIGQDGKDMIQLLADMANGTLKAKAHSLQTGETYEVGPSFRDRADAAKYLLDRAFGKASQPLTGDDAGGPIQVIVRKYEEK